MLQVSQGHFEKLHLKAQEDTHKNRALWYFSEIEAVALCWSLLPTHV